MHQNLPFRYAVGIDLGTTNSAVAYVDLSDAERRIRFLPIPQLIAPGEVGRRPILPSFLYLPGEYDLPEGSTALPWAADRDFAVGEFAREQGSRVANRLVSSAKSWLSHGGVDRTAPILPWGAPAEISKVSPVAASSRYLQHLREAWDHQMAGEDEANRLEKQLVVLTVPASFDEVARELTLEAAHEAGIPKCVLLEEPMAAFYAWLSEHEDDWQQRMQPGQLILVCDVGGGTTDFSIIGLRQGEQGLRFDRLAVGEHLMLGGDNMDITLARHLEQQLVGEPGKLETGRWHELVNRSRKAKEELLGDGERTAVDVIITGGGSRLIGGTLKGWLTEDDAERIILDGFFPRVGLHDEPERSRRGIREMGLPYVQDPAVTRHMAAFWQRFTPLLREEMDRGAPYPDFLLFNGGTLTPLSIRIRLIETVGDWFEDAAGAGWEPLDLLNPDLTLAVSMGAAYYGLVRLGQGVRIGSGSPRAYYVGVDAARSEDDLQTAVCLVPRGVEEGFATRLAEPSFAALTNQPVSFQVFTSSTRVGDHEGDVVQLDPEEVSELPPIRTVLRYGRKELRRRIPVTLGVHLSEVGTLELWAQSKESEHRWQLAFDVRQASDPFEEKEEVDAVVDRGLIDAAAEEIAATFTRGSTGHPPPSGPEKLRDVLESTVGMPKEEWPTPLIRSMADTLIEHIDGRAISGDHEARWLNLLGFCLRPGYGDPVDDWRMKQVWKLHFTGLEHPRDGGARFEWWVFWRRVAGGLSSGQQSQAYHQLRTYLEPASQRGKPPYNFPKHISDAEIMEIWMALANFEWLSAEVKADLGRKLISQFKGRRKGGPRAKELWALSRFGARNLVYGPLDRVVPPDEVSNWIDTLLTSDLQRSGTTAQALVLMAKATGDRARDVPATTRDRVAQWLHRLDDAKRFLEVLTDPDATLRQEEQDWIFGESLPAGLVLTGSNLL